MPLALPTSSGRRKRGWSGGSRSNRRRLSAYSRAIILVELTGKPPAHAKFTYQPGMACFAVAWHVMEHAHTIRHNMFSGLFPIAHQPAQGQPV